MSNREILIKELGLLPHPEGGFYAETYRDAGTIPKAVLPDRFAGDRNYSTAILFLLSKGEHSRLHRIASDEVWHFYAGDPLVVLEISPSGQLKETRLGQNVLAGDRLQHVVPAGAWFGAYPAAGSEYCLVGATVAPGFDFADFELAEAERLEAEFPEHKDVIRRLC
ncbi:MAG: cupin domain-containing protein [Bdellovibrionales bacterium]|nr:cupin domain-containing protein [Bdellovibrionales bacterium]